MAAGPPVVLQETYREKTSMRQETRSVKTYVYGLDLISVYTDDLEHGTTAQDYYFSDGLGSTVTLARASGESGAWTYDAFGEVGSKSGVLSTDFLFAGEQFDPKARLTQGLYYLRARYYDSSSGRFLTEDPLPGVVGLPLSQAQGAIEIAHHVLIVETAFVKRAPRTLSETARGASASLKMEARLERGDAAGCALPG